MTDGRASYKVGPCPNCGKEVWQRFSLLQVRTEGDRLEYYCEACDHVWQPTADERSALREFLEQRRWDIS